VHTANSAKSFHVVVVVVVVVVVGFLWLGKNYYHTARSVILLILWIRIFVQKCFCTGHAKQSRSFCPGWRELMVDEMVDEFFEERDMQ
jgi:uncharacterized membrane protein YqiK